LRCALGLLSMKCSTFSISAGVSVLACGMRVLL
jgi:hypothetical protein